MSVIVRNRVLDAIRAERTRQDEKWGEQNHGDDRWNTILGEEVGEVALAINDEEPVENLRAELIQVAAVCVSWIEAIDRRDRNSWTWDCVKCDATGRVENPMAAMTALFTHDQEKHNG